MQHSILGDRRFCPLAPDAPAWGQLVPLREVPLPLAGATALRRGPGAELGGARALPTAVAIAGAVQAGDWRRIRRALCFCTLLQSLRARVGFVPF